MKLKTAIAILAAGLFSSCVTSTDSLTGSKVTRPDAETVKAVSDALQAILADKGAIKGTK